MFEGDELIRYERQTVVAGIGEEGQLRLKRAAVIVIGAGGLGSPLLMYLAAAGIGKITVVDHDVVSISNLQRQILYVTADLSRYKAEAAAERLQQINPWCEVTAICERLTPDNAGKLIAGHDIAVDCSDNYDARYALSDAVVKAGIPMVYGAVTEFIGQASLFNYRGGPSYRELFPEEIHHTAGEQSAKAESRPDVTGATPGEKAETPRVTGATPGEDGAIPRVSEELPGVLGPLPGMIGSVQAGEVIKIITGTGELLSGRLLQADMRNLKIEIIQL